jgi:hypothetical protein
LISLGFLLLRYISYLAKIVIQGKEIDMLVRKVHDYSTHPYTVSEETVHVGRSVYTRSETVQVMSDVWEDHMRLTSITPEGDLSVHTVANWYGMRDGEQLEYAIDATPQAFADYRKRQYELAYARFLSEAEAQVSDPAVKGRVVKVVRGRTGKGIVGKVVVVMTGNYSMGYRSTQALKLGIATSPVMIEKVMPNGKVFMNHRDILWVWAKNCEVETVAEVDTATVKDRADWYAASALASLQKTAQDANERYSNQNRKAA